MLCNEEVEYIIVTALVTKFEVSSWQILIIQRNSGVRYLKMIFEVQMF